MRGCSEPSAASPRALLDILSISMAQQEERKPARVWNALPKLVAGADGME